MSKIITKEYKKIISKKINTNENSKKKINNIKNKHK